MAREGDRYGEEGRRKKLEQIREALRLKARTYAGEVLLVPSSQALAEAMGRTSGYLYGGAQGKPGERYIASIEEASGLTVIHKGGLVLAGEIGEDFQSLDQASIGELANQLPTEQKARLIGQLVQSLVEKQN